MLPFGNGIGLELSGGHLSFKTSDLAHKTDMVSLRLILYNKIIRNIKFHVLVFFRLTLHEGKRLHAPKFSFVLKFHVTHYLLSESIYIYISES